MTTGPQLPPVVILHAVQTMTAGEVRTALNTSRQTLSRYRQLYAFPAADHRGARSIMRTADLAAFLNAFGSTVKWA